jgi:hypothetical protein
MRLHISDTIHEAELRIRMTSRTSHCPGLITLTLVSHSEFLNLCCEMSTGQSDEGRPNLPAQPGFSVSNGPPISPAKVKVPESETMAGDATRHDNADTQSIPSSTSPQRSQTLQSDSRAPIFPNASKFSIENVNISQHYHFPLAGLQRCVICVSFSALILLLAHDCSPYPEGESRGSSPSSSDHWATSPSRGSSVSIPFIYSRVRRDIDYHILRLDFLWRQ